jgi:serine protease inhibitor
MQLLCLPYAPRDDEARPVFSLVILLPRAGVSLGEFERKLAPTDLDEWLHLSIIEDDEDPRLKAWQRRQPPDDADESAIRKWIEEHPVKEVDVRLPRFSVTSRFSLEQALSAMGLPLDLGQETRFSDPPKSFRPRLAPIVHQAMIRVDEAGTEAAAGTGIGLFGGPMAGPVTFNANRPFIFLIRHNVSGAILFMGRLVDPRNEAAR